MTILLLVIASSWILLLSLVAGLCLAARRGDLQPERCDLQRPEPASARGQQPVRPRGQPEPIIVHARANPGRHAERSARLAGAGTATG